MKNNRCFGCMQEKKEHPICEHCGFDERQQNLPHQLPMGSILRGQYMIGRVLGQGGFGITYLGWDLYLQMPVAIKEYYPSSFVTRNVTETSHITCYTGPEAYEANKERFMREGRALAKFKDLHHIVQIHSFFPENNTVYLVMEYAKGHTLQQHLKKNGPMALPQVLEILLPIMEDLQKVHELGVVHRDISPDNIMLLEGGGVRLLDFGAVRQVENPDQENQLSKSTEAILKQGFAPAEQYTARGSLGPWTDVYAMCATICYCLNGKLPTAAPDRSIEENPDAFIDVLPVTERQKQILRKGMALRPKDRTDSMAELSRQLKESMAPERKPEPSRQEISKPEPPAPERPRQAPPSPKPQKTEPPRQVPPKAEKKNTPVHTTPAPQKKKPRWILWAGILFASYTIAVLMDEFWSKSIYENYEFSIWTYVFAIVFGLLSTVCILNKKDIMLAVATGISALRVVALGIVFHWYYGYSDILNCLGYISVFAAALVIALPQLKKWLNLVHKFWYIPVGLIIAASVFLIQPWKNFYLFGNIMFVIHRIPDILMISAHFFLCLWFRDCAAEKIDFYSGVSAAKFEG